MKKISKFENPNDSMGLLLWQVSSLWKRKIQTALKQWGLTHTQFVILAVTNMFEEKESTQQNISDFSKIDVVTLSNSLKLMEKKGFIIRKLSSVDSRAKNICLTKLGRTILKEAIIEVEKIDCEFFSLNENDKTHLKQTLILLKDEEN